MGVVLPLTGPRWIWPGENGPPLTWPGSPASANRPSAPPSGKVIDARSAGLVARAFARLSAETPIDSFISGWVEGIEQVSTPSGRGHDWGMASADQPQEESGSPVVTEEARQRIERALGGRFTPGPADGPWPGPWGSGFRAEVPSGRLLAPGLVAWLLQDFIGSANLGRTEKIAWEIRFEFQGRRCALAFQKFGLRLYFDPDGLGDGGAGAVAEEVLAGLERGLRVAEREVFRPYAEAQVRAGNVTINNQYHRLRGMYEHFRAGAEHPATPLAPPADGGSLTAGWNQRAREKSLRFFNAVAMVNAYFSLLEHTLVLVWPFVNYMPGTDDLERFVGKRWSDKFNTVFDVTVPGTAKALYDRLRDVAEEYRNTYSHGAFDKVRGAFLIHFPRGAVPARLSDIRGRAQFEVFPIMEPKLSDITVLFDEVDEWMSTGPAEFGMQYVTSGYDVPVNGENIATARSAMDSREDFDEYLARLGYEIDQMTNMDW